MKKIFYKDRIVAICMVFSVIAGFTSCKKDHVFKDVLMMTGTATNPEVKFVVDNLPSTYAVSVTATDKVTKDVNITLAVDNSLIATYNQSHQVSYVPLPDGSYTMQGTSTSIKAGAAISTPIGISIASTANLSPDKNYVLPVTIKSADGDLSVLESSRTIYLKISRVLQFTAADISDVTQNYQYIFSNPITALTAYTWEVKFYAYGWKSTTASADNRLSRLAGFGGTSAALPGINGGCDQNMLRFGEGTGSAVNQLQVCTKQAKFYSNTIFDANRWYTLSVVNDGSTLSLYVDGVYDNSTTVTPYVYTMYGYQISMPESGYTTVQKFNGRLGEMRIFNRALSTSEIKSGICGVDPTNKSLLAYWKMNEGSGNTFNDVSGHGFSMTSVKTVTWSIDAINNKCAQ